MSCSAVCEVVEPKLSAIFRLNSTIRMLFADPYLLHDGLRIFGEYSHLPEVALASLVALESVFISTLLLAHLAVPPELLQPLGLDAVADRLGRQEPVLRHDRRRRCLPVLSSASLALMAIYPTRL